MISLKRLCALLFLAFAAPQAAAQDAVHVIPEFTFENGEKLANMRVGYARTASSTPARPTQFL
jgi:hypothetical protein